MENKQKQFMREDLKLYSEFLSEQEYIDDLNRPLNTGKYCFIGTFDSENGVVTDVETNATYKMDNGYIKVDGRKFAETQIFTIWDSKETLRVDFKIPNGRSSLESIDIENMSPFFSEAFFSPYYATWKFINTATNRPIKTSLCKKVNKELNTHLHKKLMRDFKIRVDKLEHGIIE